MQILLGRLRCFQVPVMSLPETKFAKDEQIVAARRQLVDRISALPGVTSVAATSMLLSPRTAIPNGYALLGASTTENITKRTTAI
jgi:hypothetical protein